MDSEQKHAGTARFFDVDDRVKRLSDLGDQLAAVDFELFQPELNAGSPTRTGRWGDGPLGPSGDV
jgi:hypothetical protein